MCAWLRIFLCQTFWISSNRSANVGPRNVVVAAAAEDSVGGELFVGEASGYGDYDSYGDRDNKVSEAGSRYCAPAGSTGAGDPSCAYDILIYPRPQNE